MGQGNANGQLYYTRMSTNPLTCPPAHTSLLRPLDERDSCVLSHHRAHALLRAEEVGL